MDDMAPYYPPPPPPPGSVHYPYYQQPPPSQPPPVVVPPPQHHLVQPYFPQQPPPFASYAAPLIPQPSYDELRTLFVAGLPEDVKPREIYNLFREFPGYESSHLRTPNGKSQPFAFAVFLDQQSAIGAMHALNGMVFDLEKGSTLYIDLAKSNSRSKRSRTDDERTGSDKRARSSSYSRGTPDSGKRIVCNLRDLAHANSFVRSCLYINHPDVHYAISILYMINFLDDICLMIAWSLRPETIAWSHGGHIYLIAHIAHVLHAWTLAGVGSIHIPGMGNSAYNMTGYPSAPSHGNFNGRAVHETISPNANNSSVQHFPHNNTPCPTLFVANLGPTCTEQELIQVFSRCPGFIKLKMQSTYGAPVAFVDFQDTACSTGALSHLQGTFLYSSTAGEGMRLEYARSRMGMRKKPK